MGSPDRANVKAVHPLNVIQSVLNTLDSSPLFEKSYIKAMAMTGTIDREVKYRYFTIKETLDDSD